MMRRLVKVKFLVGRNMPFSPVACIATMGPLLQASSLSRGGADNMGNGSSNTVGERHTSRRPKRGNNISGKNGPVKDRFPPLLTDLSDPRRRLALLVDASSVTPRVFRNTILPAAQKVGVPVIVRVFAVQLSSEWESLVSGNDITKKGNIDDNNKSSSSSCSCVDRGDVNDTTGTEQETGVTSTALRCPPVEFFRVERFIPISMQMEADANHIFDFRRQNKVEAICFVCGEVDRGVFEGFLTNIAGNGFNQYVLDELGMAKEVLEDGRSANGAP
ncbi:uncharacterized protein TM35_000012470 [Trypanosoma theileri]|uniref:Uncharacterized protein n=1 Tax=Trypanosoma theileri TaxID=67003 RepID=A0A1X0PA92_9TRYP|nr:uncharacterized protein TM35_000012470 [Trypanosoma theileri]ORC93370.1 hypothetical protein TM35_000012470 [Trypanosoma theileri]